MPINGIDIYHNDTVDSFHDAAASGIQFVIAKSSQGVGGVDPEYAECRQRVATTPALYFGAYHFFVDADPIAQARHFLACASPGPGDIVPFLDVETYFEGVGAAAYACAQAIYNQAGYWPGVYASDSFFTDNLAAHFPADKFVRWIARYGREPVTPYDIHQFSEAGRVPGCAGDVDLDVYPGELTDFKANLLIS